MNPTCPYCNILSEKVTGQDIYPHRPDLADKTFYRCPQCRAYVGCHPHTERPLGRLANAELRSAKMKAHEAFDRLWKTGIWGNRGQAYLLLASKMGMPESKCHIGMFDADQCKKVVEICAPEAQT